MKLPVSLVLAICACHEPAPPAPSLVPGPAAAPRAPQSAVATPSSPPPSSATPAPTPMPSAPAGPPTTCAPRGPAVVIATASGRGDPRVASVALGGDLTAVAYALGSRGKLVVVDAAGRPVAEPVALTEPNELDDAFDLVPTGRGFTLVYRDFGRNPWPQRLVARDVTASGELGPKVVLVGDLPFGWEDAWSKLWDGGAVVVAIGLGGDPLMLRVQLGPPTGKLPRTAQWTIPRPPERPGDDDSAPDGTFVQVVRTPTGYSVAAVAHHQESALMSAQSLDPRGQVTGEPMLLPFGASHRLEWSGTAWVATRVREGVFATASLPVSSESAWVPVPAPGRVAQARLIRVAGRTWAVLAAPSCIGNDAQQSGAAAVTCDAWVVALDDSRTPAGPPVPVPFGAFDIAPTGQGVAVGWLDRSLLWQPLSCH